MSAAATAPESVKDAVIEVIRKLPDDVSVEDILEAIYVRQKSDIGLSQPVIVQDAELDSVIEKRMEDVRSGRVTAVPGDEFFIRLRSQG